MPEIPAENVLAEPVNRNTAPAVAWAGTRIYRKCDDARIIISPADQLVFNEEQFENDVHYGLDFVAEHDMMLSLGIKPTRPEPGYGYIQLGDPLESTHINKVQSFTEKPEREFATIFMESGEFLWNTGMFITNVHYLRDWYLKIIPVIPFRLANLTANYTLEEEAQYVVEHYPAYPNLSMDKAVLEMTENAYVLKCKFGWADIGTWHALYECMQKTENDNVVLDSEVIMEDCRNNIVCLPKGHIGIINGLEGYIVAEQDDVLLICPKGDSSALIRKYVNEVGMKYGENYV